MIIQYITVVYILLSALLLITHTGQREDIKHCEGHHRGAEESRVMQEGRFP